MGGIFSSSNDNEPMATTTKKKKIPPPQMSDVDRATLELKNARDKLQRYKIKLEQDDVRIIERAKKAKADGNTKAALNLLKIRKIKTREVASVEQQLLNVLQMVQTIDSKKNDVQVLNAMKEGKDALTKMHEETTVDDVLNLMDEIEEQHELENEINDILQSSPAGCLSIEDEADIESELELIMGQQSAVSTTSGSTKEQTEELPVCPDTKPLPQAPSMKLPEATSATTQGKVAVAS
mmetsp:Transcript_45741/g.46370  ORF Transcript_45741/g.46370 Transcript_45741/m.46370 type:complete len:237 (+) Transcript_45741:124-834(+)